MSSKLKTALAIGSCLLAVGTTTALIGNIYKEDITNWWNETFKKESNDKKYLSVSDKISSNSVIEIDMLKLFEYLEANEEDCSDFISSLEGSSGNNALVLVDCYDFAIYLTAYNGSLYISFDQYVSNNHYVMRFFCGDLEELKSYGIINLSMKMYESFDATEINEILGVTLDGDKIEEDLGIVKIYEVIDNE